MANKLQFKSFQHYILRSQETTAYDATLFFNGKKVGHTGNNGEGGCDLSRWIDREVGSKIEALAAKIPPKYGDRTYLDELTQCVACDLVNWLMLAKDIKTGIAFRLPDQSDLVWSFAKLQKTDTMDSLRTLILRQHPDAKILNDDFPPKPDTILLPD